ncbi:hypothetical protein ABIA30_003635 [Mycobacterium sp. MAA66]
MKTVNGSLRQTMGRFVMAGGLAAVALVSPVVWSISSSSEVASSVNGTVLKADSGLSQLQWIYSTQPRVQVPHVDTSVHQSR